MSITLNTTNFIQNAGLANFIQNCSCKNKSTSIASTSNQNVLNVLDLQRDTSNAYEQIAYLLKHNELAKLNVTLLEKYTKNNATMDISTSNNNMLNNKIIYDKTQNYFTNEDANSMQKCQILYYVEGKKLQPLTSPYIVPGIYRNITSVPNSNSVSAECAQNVAMQNVYLSTEEAHGRIINANKFYHFYIFKNEQRVSQTQLPNDTQLPRVLPLKSYENKTTNVPKIITELVDEKQQNIIPKQCDTLSKLAYNILKLSKHDDVVIDRKRNEIVRTENNTKQKIVYRFLSPENFKLKTYRQMPTKNVLKSETIKSKLKVGRPRKQNLPTVEDLADAEAIKTITNTTNNNEAVKVDKNITAPQCTRSGRVIKSIKPAQIASSSLDEYETNNIVHDFLNELKDKDYKCSKNLITPKSNETNSTTADYQQTKLAHKRRVPPESICPTCNKTYLGRRLQKHFIHHPDHMQPVKSTNSATTFSAASNDANLNEHMANNDDMTLFRFLISKLQKSNLNDDQRAEIFLNEINDFVEQLQLRSSRIIRNTSGLHFVTARSARVLGIPEGQYALDMSAIEAPPDVETICQNYDLMQNHKSANVTVRNIDYTALSMSLDDTITDEAAQKLNLSAGGKLLPPSEESLLRAVSDLVAIKKLDTEQHDNSNVPTSIVPHYDHVSDNAVEALTMKETHMNSETQPTLDLAVDFFKFNKK